MCTEVGVPVLFSQLCRRHLGTRLGLQPQRTLAAVASPCRAQGDPGDMGLEGLGRPGGRRDRRARGTAGLGVTQGSQGGRGGYRWRCTWVFIVRPLRVSVSVIFVLSVGGERGACRSGRGQRALCRQGCREPSAPCVSSAT